ncbi:gluconokinase [Rhizobium sp. DKSPLA3]|uniref:Gluconokinase n=1 Tax=Rhizobium quercicola TaxID=2901226 RepID=A0A9X1T239_9HYPH|nr:gluconokinase [Rhizobium quercicola]MCD7111371.1 gluconokinase [Rhizobium quercicola]
MTASSSPSGFVVVMGTAGTGKSEIARRIAGRIGCRFVEADELHAPEAVAQMRDGFGLTDEQRRPWLDAVCDRALAQDDRPVIIACSALKRSYRDLLRARLGSARFVSLEGTAALILERLQARRDHFATASLLASQLATLETPQPDEDALRLDIASSPETLTDLSCAWLFDGAVSARHRA